MIYKTPAEKGATTPRGCDIYGTEKRRGGTVSRIGRYDVVPVCATPINSTGVLQNFFLSGLKKKLDLKIEIKKIPIEIS